MLNLIIILGLINSTILVCLKKWGVLEMYDIYRQNWWPSANCFLCLGFWMAAAESLFFIVNDIKYAVVPFAAASLTNYLTNIAVIHDYNKGK